jgi:hypothetical protein
MVQSYVGLKVKTMMSVNAKYDSCQSVFKLLS